jgi:broad specificity phosphatase PhoE
VGNARTFTLVRHGRTTFNDQGLVNGDPRMPVELDEVGRSQCLALRASLAGRDFDLAIRTRFQRTGESLALILDGRGVPVVVYPELDDVRLGIFEGGPIDAYRAWRRTHRPEEPPPGEGESRIDALYRYMRGFERMLGEEDAGRVLAVLHDVPIRCMLNAVTGADPLDGPVTRVENAEVHDLGEVDVERALGAMRDRLGL